MMWELIKAVWHSIRTGKAFYIIEEGCWNATKQDSENLCHQRNLLWDCVDHMIAGGSACDCCLFKGACDKADAHGCKDWTLLDEEVDRHEQEATQKGTEGAACV